MHTEEKVQVHSVFDSASLERQAQMALVEAEKQRHKDVVMSQLSEGRIIKENDFDNYDRQAGRRFVSTILEQKLLKLVPTLTFKLKVMPDWLAKDLGLMGEQKMRSYWFPMPDGTETYCGATMYPIVNEFDIIIAKKKVAPAINPATGFLEDRIEGLPDETKYDLSKPVFEGDDLHLTSDEQWYWSPDNRIPGWRSVLLRLVERNLVTPNQVEKEFLAADRASWATKMGKQKHSVL